MLPAVDFLLTILNYSVLLGQTTSASFIMGLLCLYARLAKAVVGYLKKQILLELWYIFAVGRLYLVASLCSKKKKIILTSPRSQASTFPSLLIQELSGEVAPVSKNKSYKSDSSCNTSYCPSNITAPGCWAGCGIELDLVLLLFSLKLSSLKQLCVFAGVFANVCAAKTPI